MPTEEAAKKKSYSGGKLSPKKDLDNVDVYFDAIATALSDDEIRNIAVSGAYCSGKSSILSSYESRQEKKFIHISLAHFQSEKDSPVDEKLLPVLEGKILNQLVHQIKAGKIPLTRFPIKRTLSAAHIWLRTLLTAFFLLTFLHLSLSHTWIAFVETLQEGWLKFHLELTTRPGAFFLSGLIGLCILVYAIYRIIATQKLQRYVKRLNIQGHEIELFEKDHESVFDRYLDEVLYLFEQSEIDVIVFEDVDRYNMELIFERLREVNTLANLRLGQKREKRVLKFFYLLRDDLFLSKDRTKFFDYIIPVIPVVSPTNAYAQLRQHLEGDPLLEPELRHFLQDISLYIDDMRLLKNICHEYRIYAAQLKPNGIQLDCARLFAMIAYKNTFPHDHSLLQINRGYVHGVFKQKRNLWKLKAVRYENELKSIEEEEKATREEHLLSKREVIYLFALHYLPSTTTASIKAQTDEELDNQLRQLDRRVVQVYDTRLQNIANRETKQKNNLRCRQEEAEQELRSIESQKLWELLLDTDGSWLKTVETGHSEVMQNHYFGLLKYLILSGYIDEGYADYLTYFYPGDLDPKDKIFVMNVKNRKPTHYAYSLSNPGLVMEKLQTSDFDQAQTLNFSLLTHLLIHAPTCKELTHLFGQLARSRNYEFIIQYLQVTPKRESFVYSLNQHWPDFAADVYYEDKFPDPVFRQFTLDTLHACPPEMLRELDNYNALKNYISDSPDYLDIPSPNVEVLIPAFQALGVSFASIDFERSNRELFKAVYQNSLYALNRENIHLMLVQMYHVTQEQNLTAKNYTLICSKPHEPLYQYVQDHITEYFMEMLQFADDSIQDALCYVLAALNNDRLHEEWKIQYIQRLTTPIPDLSKVPSTLLQGHLLDRQLVAYTPENLLTYWKGVTALDEHLVRYINRYDQKIRLPANTEDGDKKKLLSQVVRCRQLRIPQYCDFLAALGAHWKDNFDIQGLSDEQMICLAENHFLDMTWNHLQFIRSHYPNALYRFIGANAEAYPQLLTKNRIIQSEILKVLEMDISDTVKKQLVDLAAPITIQGKPYSDDVKLYILEKKRHAGDMAHLYQTYHSLSDRLKSFTRKEAAAQLRSAPSTPPELSPSLVGDLLSGAELSRPQQLQLLCTELKKDIPKPFVNLYLIHFERDDLARLVSSGRRRALPKEPFDETSQLLEILKQKKWIQDYHFNEAKDVFEVNWTPASLEEEPAAPK